VQFAHGIGCRQQLEELQELLVAVGLEALPTDLSGADLQKSDVVPCLT
jgi:hypothetical protein